MEQKKRKKPKPSLLGSGMAAMAAALFAGRKRRVDEEIERASGNGGDYRRKK